MPKYLYFSTISISKLLQEKWNFLKFLWPLLSIMIFVLLKFTFNFHLSQQALRESKQDWRPSLLSDNKSRSSAYNRQFSFVSISCTGKQVSEENMESISLINMLNRMGLTHRFVGLFFSKQSYTQYTLPYRQRIVLE